MVFSLSLNNKNMATGTQKRLRLRRRVFNTIYPALIKAGKIFGLKAGVEVNVDEVTPPVSFYSLRAVRNNGEEINFESFRGKKVLIVNTASNCGYTPQFSELKWLHEWYKGKLHVVGFPANDFKEQEKGSDEEIATYCVGTFGIKFPLMKKSSVVKSEEQNSVFEWLTNKDKNGWNEREPEWNFAKYLINEKGTLTHYFGPGVSPTSRRIIHALGRPS
jgi:glutathione peroxidase